jgi:hypothetical protein
VIFSYIVDLNSVACLALCSRELWAVGEGHIRKGANARIGQWAGNRLICAHNRANSVPERMEFSDAQKARLKQYENNLTGFAEDYDNSSLQNFEWPWKFLQRTLLQRDISQNDWHYVDQLIKGPCTTLLVLRNLSTHEYVRGEPLEAFNNERGRKLAEAGCSCCEPLTLADVLVPLIHWSPPEHVGPWAGCRFDITHIDDVRGDQGDHGETVWKDFTLEGMQQFQSAHDDYCSFCGSVM